MTVPHIAFVGYSGSGKTTLAAQIVVRLKQRGYRVGTLKHDAHDFQLDYEGKDTFKYTQAGADIVMITSKKKLNYLEHYEEPYTLNQLLQRFSGMDMVLIEGYKNEDSPKILVARTEEQLALRHRLSGLLAIASGLQVESDVPVFDIDDLDGITAFVEARLGKGTGLKSLKN